MPLFALPTVWISLLLTECGFDFSEALGPVSFRNRLRTVLLSAHMYARKYVCAVSTLFVPVAPIVPHDEDSGDWT